MAGGLGLFLAGVGLTSAGSGGFRRVDTLLLVVGGILTAAAILGPRLPQAYKSAALMTLNTILLLVSVELGAAVVLEIHGRLRPDHPTPMPDHGTSPYYADKEWGAELWGELDELRANSWYHPHEIWRRKPYRGAQHTIDVAGLRITPGVSCEPGAFLVYAFGGSTMWGLGSPDWGTIPAYLQIRLSQLLTRPVCVKNFADLAVTSTQSLITLERQLQRCRVPDLVVFYDGVNDLTYARIFGLAGAHAGLREAAQRLDSDAPPPRSWVEGLASIQLARRFVPRERHPPHRYAERPDDIPAGLGEEIVQVYLNNYHMVEALGEKYGFTAVFFWQPHIWMGRKPLTAPERRLAAQTDSMAGPPDDASRRPGRVLYEQVYAAVARSAQSRATLHYIADVLDDRQELVYVDSHHITPEGNRLVADRMVRAMTETLHGVRGASRVRCPT